MPDLATAAAPQRLVLSLQWGRGVTLIVTERAYGKTRDFRFYRKPGNDYYHVYERINGRVAGTHVGVLMPDGRLLPNDRQPSADWASISALIKHLLSGAATSRFDFVLIEDGAQQTDPVAAPTIDVDDIVF